jgi:hypothetical protein
MLKEWYSCHGASFFYCDSSILIGTQEYIGNSQLTPQCYIHTYTCTCTYAYTYACASVLQILKNHCAAATRDLENANRAGDEVKRELAQQNKLVADACNEASRAADLEKALARVRDDTEREKAAMAKERDDLQHARKLDAKDLLAMQDKCAELRGVCDTLAADKMALQEERARLHCRVQVRQKSIVFLV